MLIETVKCRHVYSLRELPTRTETKDHWVQGLVNRLESAVEHSADRELVEPRLLRRQIIIDELLTAERERDNTIEITVEHTYGHNGKKREL